MGKNILIVGAGLFGATCARRLTDFGHRCRVIDKRSHTGGNCHVTNIDGINIHTYGIHIFHTNSHVVMKFIRKFTMARDYKYKVLVSSRGRLYSFPVNLLTLNQLFDVTTPTEADELFNGCDSIAMDKIHDVLFKGYSEKQWGMPFYKIPPEVIRRIPIRTNYDDTYFHNARYECILDYSLLFGNLLRDSIVDLDCNYYTLPKASTDAYDRIIFTGEIDKYFNCTDGSLGYRSLKFVHEAKEVKDAQGCIAIHHADSDIEYTRSVEYKHLAQVGKVERVGCRVLNPHSLIVKEFPTAEDEPYYPIPTEENKQMYARYLSRANEIERIEFGGRLGSYAYMDMDVTILEAMKLSNKVAQELQTK